MDCQKAVKALLLLVAWAVAWPSAAQQALSVWPASGTPLTRNPVVLLEARGLAADWLKTVQLEGYTAAGTLRLQVLSVVERPGLRQVLLQPTELLEAGWVLRIRAKAPATSPDLRVVHPRAAVYQRLLGQQRWPIQTRIDTTAPYWLGPATPVGYSERPTACGPMPHAAIWCPLRETQPLLLAVQIKLGKRAPQRWLLPLERDAASSLLLPTDSCLAGLWVQRTSLVSVVALDASGNAAPMPDGTLVLNIPTTPLSPRRSWASSAHKPVLLTLGVVLFAYWWMGWHIRRLGQKRKTRHWQAGS